MLDLNKRVESDDRYRGEDSATVKVPASMLHSQEEKMLIAKSRVRRQQEHVNKLIKQFKVVGTKTIFHHDISFHGDCFRACTVLTQLAIEYNPSRMYPLGHLYTDPDD